MSSSPFSVDENLFLTPDIEFVKTGRALLLMLFKTGRALLLILHFKRDSVCNASEKCDILIMEMQSNSKKQDLQDYRIYRIRDVLAAVREVQRAFLQLCTVKGGCTSHQKTGSESVGVKKAGF